MRRLILASTLLLSACATAPQQQTAAPTPAPQPVVPVERQALQLAGASASDLVSHFGRPALQIREGSSIKLQFRGHFCILDAYLYPGANGVLRVTHIDTRLASGADVDQATCLSSLDVAS
jgi:hypothetical protein